MGNFFTLTKLHHQIMPLCYYHELTFALQASDMPVRYRLQMFGNKLSPDASSALNTACASSAGLKLLQ
jgi:hypothetical protein